MQELGPLNEVRPIIIGSVVSIIPEPYASSAPDLMSFHRSADEKIKEAIAKGEFDNLPGKGRPLDLDAYFATPEDLRIGYSLLKNADIVPEEMKLLKQIDGLKKSLDSCTSQIEKRTIQRQLSEKITNLNMRMERYRKKRS
jgi:DnaJ homologue, subfamily C, member 28, conserved domain